MRVLEVSPPLGVSMTAPLCFPSIVTEPVILTFAKVLRRLYEKSRKSATHEKTSVNRFLCGR